MRVTPEVVRRGICGADESYNTISHDSTIRRKKTLKKNWYHLKILWYGIDMNKTSQYYSDVLKLAISRQGSARAVATALGATSGPAVNAWLKNGVAYKWRPRLDDVYGAAYRKHLREIAGAPQNSTQEDAP
jgi:hypothetical protein